METTDSNKKTIYSMGFWSAGVAFAGALCYSIAQTLQVLGLLGPPLDGIILYGFSFCIATPFIVAMLALHHVTPEEKKFWSHGALLFAVVYAVYVNLNYVVQLTTVIPMSFQGRLDEVRLLDQSPHSLFWDIDALGYIFMSLSTLFAVPLFATTGPDKWLRRFFLANGLVIPLFAIVYFYPTFSLALLWLGSPWMVTAVGSLWLLRGYFRRRVG